MSKIEKNHSIFKSVEKIFEGFAVNKTYAKMKHCSIINVSAIVAK